MRCALKSLNRTSGLKATDS